MAAELGSEHMKRSKNLMTSSSNEVQLHQAIADRKEPTGIRTGVKREMGIDIGKGSGTPATETTRAPLATDTDTGAGPEQEAAATMTEAQGNPRQLQAALNPPHKVCSGEGVPDLLPSMARDVIRLR